MGMYKGMLTIRGRARGGTESAKVQDVLAKEGAIQVKDLKDQQQAVKWPFWGAANAHARLPDKLANSTMTAIRSPEDEKVLLYETQESFPTPKCRA